MSSACSAVKSSQFTNNTTDELVALTAWNVNADRQDGRRLGKTFTRLSDGTINCEATPKAKFFKSKSFPVRSIGELHSLLRNLATDGRFIVVRGATTRLETEVIARRKRPHADGMPVSLADAPRRWQVIDIDKLPNLKGIRIPQEDADARRFVLSVLPEAISKRTTIMSWSSSTGIGDQEVPSHLSAHVWFMTDEGLDERATKALHIAIDAHVRKRLAEHGCAVWEGRVDPSISSIVQPIYVAKPQLSGIADPFPDGRQQMIIGDGDTVIMEELKAEIVQQAEARAPLVKNRRHASAEIIDLDAVRRRKIGTGTGDERGRMCARSITDLQRGFARGALEDIVRVVHDRVRAGVTDPTWAAWKRAGGVPEGERDTYAVRIGSLIAVLMSDSDILNGQLVPEITRQLGAIMDPVWVAAEWNRLKYHASVVERAEDGARGIKIMWNKHWRDPRYIYGCRGLLKTFGLTEDDMVRLRLRCLVTARVRTELWRRDHGATPITEIQAERRKTEAEVCRLREQGMKQKDIAEELGITLAMVEGALKRLGMTKTKTRVAYTPIKKERETAHEDIENDLIQRDVDVSLHDASHICIRDAQVFTLRCKSAFRRPLGSGYVIPFPVQIAPQTPAADIVNPDFDANTDENDQFQPDAGQVSIDEGLHSPLHSQNSSRTVIPFPPKSTAAGRQTAVRRELPALQPTAAEEAKKARERRERTRKRKAAAARLHDFVEAQRHLDLRARAIWRRRIWQEFDEKWKEIEEHVDVTSDPTLPDQIIQARRRAGANLKRQLDAARRRLDAEAIAAA